MMNRRSMSDFRKHVLLVAETNTQAFGVDLQTNRVPSLAKGVVGLDAAEDVAFAVRCRATIREAIDGV